MLESLDISRRGIVSIQVAKTKALISCAVTAQLICAFVFAYADCLITYVADLYFRIMTGSKKFGTGAIDYRDRHSATQR